MIGSGIGRIGGSSGTDMIGGAAQRAQEASLQQQKMNAEARQRQTGPAVGDSGQAPPKGSMIIADFFTPSTPQDQQAHGEIAKMAALQNGFKGPVMTMAQPETPQASTAQRSAQGVIGDPTASRAEILKAVTLKTAAQTVGNLGAQTQVVEGATASGAENTVLNISMGTSKASVVQNLYAPATAAWDPDANARHIQTGKNVAKNYAKAYGLDLNKLESSDSKVSGPERMKLQQHLINHVDHTFSNNSAIKNAKAEWASSVKNFESKNNSVVISAGNQGTHPNMLIDDANGHSAKAPGDFQRNVLDTPEVTSVGATRWLNGVHGPKEKEARYSSRSASIGIYASGSVDTDRDGKPDTYGTSFSAPRIAATMAGLHKRHPGMSSKQVENLMRNEMTHGLETRNGGTISVLDYQKSANFLAGQ